MVPNISIFLSILIPITAAILNLVIRERANLRDFLTFVASVLTFFCVLAILISVGNETTEEIVLLSVLPGLKLSFQVEPLGLLFALLASGLWILTHVYAIGYMRQNNEAKHSRFFAYFSLAIACVMGIAFSSNMFTLFFFYEALTLTTYPLVAHKGTESAVKGARTYFGILIGTSIGLQLTAIVWTFLIAGTLDFSKGGILNGHLEGPLVTLLLFLYIFGIGKAALMPFHKWLPAAMVAPTPVSALLHAVAVVKAGVFTVLKVGIYIFGIEFLQNSGASYWLMWFAAGTIIIASLIAITKDNLKARLAYSTVSQLSYITLGVALATSMGVLGAGLHIVMHAMGKITLFMCAGSIYVATKKTNISQMTGLGKVMPITFGAFFIGSLSIIGLPPLGGSWSKWFLLMGALEADQWFMMVVLIFSSLLNIAYLLPIVAKGFFLPQENDLSQKYSESTVLIWLPPAITAMCCIILFFTAGHLLDFLAPIVLPE